MPDMNRLLLPVLLLCGLATACSRTAAAASDSGNPGETPPATNGVRFEVVSKRRVQSPEKQILVRLRAVNGGPQGIAYPGWTEDSPTYSLEFQEGGAWSRYNLGWCGTGLIDFMLKPGSEMSLELTLPDDGKTYRATFGDPLLVTPPIVADAP